MSTSTMHFGPEWMRTKHQPLSRSQPPPSPPPATNLSGSGASTYSALVSAVPPASPDKGDEMHPFRYSKDELLRIYQEGGGKGGLGLEVERWEGVVREVGAEPTALREMTEAEKKLFAGPLNSELRRRLSQTADYLSPLATSNLERSRMSHTPSVASNSPLRERFGGLKRRDSSGNNPDATLSAIPRKPSLSALQAPLSSPREASPRTRNAYTPGFDGILNSGDSWMARRRVSETSLKAGSLSEEESQLNGKPSGILEEKEEEIRRSASVILPDEEGHFPSASSYDLTDEPDQYTTPETTTNSYLQEGITSSYVPGYHHVNGGPPPGLMDLAAVEWSYKDPTGQVQGPFRADLMQRWFNEGYFASDLPMKRTHVDTSWSTVDELIKNSTGDNIFLSPRVSALSVRPSSNGSSMQGLYSSEQTFSEPYQPAPIRSLRTSTLESYLNSASLASDSPSSSVGASLGNHSPEPSSFGGRDGRIYFSDTAGTGHLSRHSLPATTFGSFTSEQDLGASDSPHNTPGYGPHDPWLGHVSVGSPGIANARDLAVDSIYLGSLTNIDATTNTERVLSNTFSTLEQSQRPGVFNTGSIYVNDKFDHDSSHTGLEPYGQLTSAAPPISMQNLQQHPPISDHPHSPRVFGYRGLVAETGLPQPSKHVRGNAVAPPPRSPWKAIPEATSSVLSVPDVMESSATNISLPTTQTSSPSAWPLVDESLFLSSSVSPQQPSFGVPASDVMWKGELNLSNAITGTLPPNISPPQGQAPMDFIDLNNVNTSQATTLLQVTSPSAPAEEDSSVSTMSLLKTAKPGLETSGHSEHTGVDQKSEEVTTSVAVQKFAWAIEEEPQRRKGSAPSVSLREIQEAEAKRAETRKAVEREKERLVRATLAMDAKESQPFTTSWGLPTSQAGARNNTGAVKEPPTLTPPSASLPVWTTPLKQPLPKKSMKEIQEEEEKRKKLATRDVMAASVPKRHSETTTKVTTPTTPSSNTSAWTTVGPNGKTSAVLAPPIGRSAQVVSPSLASSSSRPTGFPAQRQAVTSSLKPRPLKEDTPYSPSHDFLRWLSDSLKGLNSSVNVEEIVAMLLSFPLDPDQSTIEIISDTIYSNSTTLDGRRFASEFIAKRKADASSRSQNALTPGKPTPKPVSIADVVKATPKAAQPEWGFKVVNKKKKGSRP